jgi:hypothetical protein
MPSGMRYRMPSDAWPLHQLESDITPALVRQLEGLTSLAWSMKPQRRWQRDELSELVVERDGTIVGWAGWRERLHQGYIRLGLLAQSDDRDMASALVAHALLAIHAAYPQARVVVRLRDYQMGLHSALLDHNFRELGREALHIKHGRLQLVPKKVSRLFEIALDPLAGAPRPFSRGVPVYPGQK